MTVIPTLETERLRLRPMTIEDWPAYEQLMKSERAAHMGGPHTTESAWGMFCNDVALWTLSGHGALSVDLLETGECIGQVGINRGPLFPEYELGWYVYEHAEGKGYAMEAALALRGWAFNVRGLETLVSYIEPDNARSIKLAERMGAYHDTNASSLDPDDLVYRHPVK
ncbi:hypothetical protein PsAD5_04309 [Pseudovibrio sp. Ad5]|uniref:GNAT family N-acetyltransferase n=1 Tax=Pseudovibrio sp. Ad5 TaxID=989436 RepID=UPI0007B28258|nr:GNAT family N-acetyltransferase [Pseudovibrio sp. Ad5]KZK91171.1 hypothetical protein PsAD5_04309 [Pseudovibrio sp. Ad5]